jgi:hypothetical protein
MNQIEITKALADEHHRDRALAASGSWLAKLATCCRSSAWGRGVRRLMDAVVAWTRRRSVTGVACCA